MGDARTGPRLIINYMTVYQLAADESFFRRVPAFMFMRDQAREAHRRVSEDTLNSRCSGCGGVKAIMMPVFRAFANQFVTLANESPEALSPLVEYIAERRGYRPMPIVLYHKDSDGRTITTEV